MVVATGLLAAVATLALPGGTTPGVWDIVVAIRPDWSLPALALSIVGTVGAVVWLIGRGIGNRDHPAGIALSAALAAFLLAPAPLDPSPIPFAALGLWYLTRGRPQLSRRAANDNVARRLSWVATSAPHDTIVAIRREG